jgi:hypothetical protein
MEVSGKLQAPATLPPEKTPSSVGRAEGWVGPTAGLDVLKKRRISCPAK